MKETWELLDDHVVVTNHPKWGMLLRRVQDYSEERKEPECGVRDQVKLFLVIPIAEFSEPEFLSESCTKTDAEETKTHD